MESHCDCKSSCSVKRKENGTRGCPCKGRNVERSDECTCGTRNKSCQNRAMTENSGRERDDRSKKGTRAKQGREKGFRLSSKPTESEDTQREKEHKDVKDFIATLDKAMVRKLAIRSLQRGIGSMDYIETLLIMEDDLNEDENFSEFSNTATDQATGSALAGTEPSNQGPIPSNTQNPEDVEDSASGAVPDWCVCGKCHPMPQEVENKCCKLKKCITLSSQFAKLCLDPDVVELCIKSTGDIRNDRRQQQQGFSKSSL